MTNEEIRAHLDNAVTHLKATNAKYQTWLANQNAGKYPNGSEWGSAFNELRAIRDGLATTPPPPPPPTPTGSWPNGGHGYWRPGGNLTNINVQDIIIAANWNIAQARSRPKTTKLLQYTSGFAVDTRQSQGYWYGFNYADLKAGGWWLKDSSGNEIRSSGYPNSVLADVGDVDYQQAWYESVLAYLKQGGWDGIQIDDVDYTLSHYAAVSVPKYPTNQKWADAQASFVNNVGSKLKAQGYYVTPNVGGSNVASFALMMKTGTSGTLLEDYGRVYHAADAKAILDGGLDVLALDLIGGNESSLRSVDNGRAVYMTK